MTGGPPATLRFSRDRRGYENFYLVHSTTNSRGKTRARILYWFRTPPGVKVGRLPFDAEMQRTIEAQNPGVVFDWKRLLATPIPPPTADVEKWRERRRLEKAERAARRALHAEDESALAETAEKAETADAESAETVSPAEEDGPPEVFAAEGVAPSPRTDGSTPAPGDGTRRRRRRRRGRRGGGGPGAPPSAPPSENPPGSN